MLLNENEISFGIGEEILSSFIEQKLKIKINNMKHFELKCFESSIQITLSGSYLGLNGKLEMDLNLIDFSYDLMDEETLIFEIIPKNSLSHILKSTIKVFDEKLKPAINIDKSYLKINLYEFFQKWKPEFSSFCYTYNLKKLKINQKSLDFILIKKR